MKTFGSKKGFTLIEIALAVLFISIILLSAAVIIYNVTVIYQKGLSMRAVNSTGRELVNEFNRSVNSAPTTNLVRTYCNRYADGSEARTRCKNDNARLFIYQQTTANINVNGTNKTVPVHGVFCTGRHSYIWNTGYALNQANNSPYIAIYGSGYNARDKRLRLLKVPDATRSICSGRVNASNYDLNGASNNYAVGVGTGSAQEILESSDNDLALYDLVIFKPTQHELTLHTFLSGTFILATKNGTVDITGTGEFCKEAPDGLTTDFAYCAINKFNFAMNAKGQQNTGD